MVENTSSQSDNSEQTNLVNNFIDQNSDLSSHSDLSNLDSPSRLSPLEGEVNNDSLLPFSRMKMKGMLEEAYFVPINQDETLSPVMWPPPVISNNGPSAFTKVKSSHIETTSNNNSAKHSNLIKLNHIKSAFAKPESCNSPGSASMSPVSGGQLSTSPMSVGQLFALKKRIKREAGEEESLKNGLDPMVSSSMNLSPLRVKEESADHDSSFDSKSFKVSSFVGSEKNKSTDSSDT